MGDEQYARERSRDVLVILPTYNERENLEWAVRQVQSAAPAVDILIIDDGSPDGTGEIADALAAAIEAVSVEHRRGTRGLGTAYVHGFGIALERGYRYVVEMDADGSHAASELPALIRAAREGAGLVIGSRWVPGGRIVNWPWYRRAISYGGTRVARIALRSRLHDLTSGFRVINTEWLRRIDLSAVDSHGYGFQVETAWMFERLPAPIAEVPITFVERSAGRSKMSLGIALEAFRNVLRWGWRLRFGATRQRGK